MVSSQSSAAPNPPLSYADRAKKAQNTRPKAQPQAGSQGIALPSSSSASTSTPHPGPSTAANASMNVARTARADGNSAPSALSSAKSISGPSSPSRSSANVNGDVSSTARDSVVSQPQPQGDVTVKSTAAPAVNVWSLRKEQMARVRSSQGTTASVPVQNSPSPHQADNETLEEVASSSNALQNVTNQRPSTNVPGRNPANGEDDAFVVRPRASILPPSEDTESWPEVGKSVSHTSTGSGQAESEPAGQGHERDASREGSQGQGPSRKSEKTKWVPIPAAEMQEAADAFRPPNPRHRPHHMHQHNHGHSRHPPHPGPSSASGSGSQGQSRAHSVAGAHHSVSNSHTSSVAQSQAQSRTGSSHSSPMAAPGRGERRLPEEGAVTQRSAVGPGAASVASRSISIRSSRTSSPQAFLPAFLPPEFIPGATAHRGQPPASRGSGPAEELAGVNGVMSPYYALPHVPPPMSAQRSYHSPHSSGSPVQSPYGLPPPAPAPHIYGAPGSQVPVHHSYAGTPPYPMYSSYYGYPPYVYWAPQPVSHSPAAPDGMPLPMLARPPPPGESEAAAGYRDGEFVLPPPATYTRPEEQVASGPEGQSEGTRDMERGRRARELSFGSIDVVVTASASPVASAHGDALGLDVGGSPANIPAEAAENPEDNGEKPIPPFVIGVAPGEAGPARIRSRTRTQSKGRTLVMGEAVVGIARTASEQSEGIAQINEAADPAASGVQKAVEEIEAAVKAIDLTETKWEFGTTQHPDESDGAAQGQESASDVIEGQVQPVLAHPLPPRPPLIMTTTNGALSSRSPVYAPSALPPQSASEPNSADDWKVKDYGFGFGRKSGYQPAISGDGSNRREWQPEREYYGRPRRGSVRGGYNYDRGGHERGGFNGRRARGGGYGRGGYHSRTHSRGGGAYHVQGQQPPFVVQPPQAQPLQADLNGFYPPPPPSMTTYYTHGYEAYPPTYPPYAPPTQNLPAQPPLPMPQSPLSFPLDPLRYHLLGQLEYYLSPQNMAMDFFLRQKMDSAGWIEISLLSSFNRVKRLTEDWQLVKDVLTLSSLVEVYGDWVRMRDWKLYVLPTAPASTVYMEQDPSNAPPSQDTYVALSSTTHDSPEAEDGEDMDLEEDEEEDVVFVLGKDAHPTWTSEVHAA